MATINIQSQDDNTVLISHLYNPAQVCSQMLPQQDLGEAKKPRRRRRKSKAKEAGEAAGMKKRKLSNEQVHLLEMNFGNEHKLESERKDRLASELGLDPRQVAVWFQNRRARWKNKKLEDEYNTLKNAHDSVVIEKSHLETEMLELKQQLSEAKREIQELLERGSDRTSINSPTSSSITNNMDVMTPPFLGEMFVEDQYEDVFYYMQETNYNQGMEWLNLYM